MPGLALVAIRITSMLVLLLACIPLYYLWRLLRRPRFWPRIFLAGVGWIAGLRVKRSGTPRKRTLFLANHLSWLDIPAIASVSGSAFIAHDGLAQIAVLKQLCAMNDTVFVARHRRTSVAAQAEQVRHALDDTGALTLFPEGTTGNGQSLLPFKSALLAAVEPLPAGVSVQPVFLDYGAEAQAIAWYGEESGIANFIRILARWRPIKVEVHFLTPLADNALNSRKEMAAEAGAAIDREMARA
ncbi:lysophospholipid acyltransferase family protein [Croceicoccus estronivorus]|uniref:lysophospholipid acyltransferase family protein n=1 Tax=Croceicoccus estronivorus TaxID=1172626 RepID=UPI000B29038D|nr:lysophospholipid acyltransferase family protein [Croceicoccus estronivorus]